MTTIWLEEKTNGFKGVSRSQPRRITTSFKDVAKLIFRKGGVVAVTGRAGVGKSTFSLALILYAAIHMKQTTVYIDNSTGLTVPAMIEKTKRLQSRHKAGLVVIDHMQFPRGTGIDLLQNMAKKLKVLVVVVSQLRRNQPGSLLQILIGRGR